MKIRDAMCLLLATLAGTSIFAGVPLYAAEPLQPEVSTVEKLGAPSPHWLLINDMNFLGYMDSKVLLIDTDTERDR